MIAGGLKGQEDREQVDPNLSAEGKRCHGTRDNSCVERNGANARGGDGVNCCLYHWAPPAVDRAVRIARRVCTRLDGSRPESSRIRWRKSVERSMRETVNTAAYSEFFIAKFSKG